MPDAVSAASAKLAQAIADVQTAGKALAEAAIAAVQPAPPADPAVPGANVGAVVVI
jgi:predicted RNA polymerase sigma factor